MQSTPLPIPAVAPPTTLRTASSASDPALAAEPTGTVYLRDPAKSLIVRNDSPDVSFDYGINAYRGCENGCIHCFARPTHEYLASRRGWTSRRASW